MVVAQESRRRAARPFVYRSNRLSTNDPFQLDRFVIAQNATIDAVRGELRTGKKRSHWMWFVFPQLYGLGNSATAQHYAIRSMDEAQAYLDHPILGSRLLECVGLVNAVEDRTALQIFGAPDHLKFHSSMTLFALTDPGHPASGEALTKYFGGTRDRLTVELLARR